jgi:hypothetical protein
MNWSASNWCLVALSKVLGRPQLASRLPAPHQLCVSAQINNTRHSSPVAKSNNSDRSIGGFGILLTTAVFACLMAFGIQTGGFAAERTQVQTAQGMRVALLNAPAVAIMTGQPTGLPGNR